MSLPPSDPVEGEVARLDRLRFSPAVEKCFEAEGRVARIRLAQLTLLSAIVLYDVFLLTDWNILRDMFSWMVVARLCIFTPIALLIVWLFPRTSRDWQVDIMVMIGTICAVLLPTSAMVFSTSSYVVIYQFGSVLTATYMVLVQRVRFRMVVVGLFFVTLVQLVCVGLRSDIDGATFQFIVGFYLIADVLMIMGSYVLERTERYGFLQHLRSQLLLERIADMARTDQLTGLFNRHHLASIRDKFVEGCDGETLAALMIDVDHFKRFNDTQGHLAGDECLRTIGELVREVLRITDSERAAKGVAVRFGGEEFLVLLPGMTAPQAAALGEAIRHRLEAERIPHPGIDADAVVTLSIGVAACQMAGFVLEALVDAADTALYRAKHSGRNRVLVA